MYIHYMLSRTCHRSPNMADVQQQQLVVRVVTRRSTAAIKKLREQGYWVVDVTSKSDDPTFVKFSPFFAHGDLAVPGQDRLIAESVEGAWQGLKVFENEGISTATMQNKSMRGLKRGGKKLGRPLGHLYEGRLLDYKSARELIYIPLYVGVILQKRLRKEVRDLLRVTLEKHEGRLALLDYMTNGDINDLRKPLSHAALLKQELQRLHVLGDLTY